MDLTSRLLLAASGGGVAASHVYVDDVFSTYLYDGTGSTQSINNGIDLAGEGGLVWIKDRGATQQHWLFDTERGVQKAIRSNGTNAEYEFTDALSSFNSNGFTSGAATQINTSGNTFASWTFRKAPGFFDIVTWNGDGTNPRQIAHSLGSTPGMILIKSTSDARKWVVYHIGTHSSAPESNLLVLNETDASVAQGWFANTAPTSTHFSVESSSNVNASGKSYVAYVFAHDDAQFGTGDDESIIKCGSYTGGYPGTTFVNLGWEPQWLLVKRTTQSGPWTLVDNMRGLALGSSSDAVLFANATDTETTDNVFEIAANGFYSTGGGSESNYTSSDTFVYMAIRRPHKPPSAGTEVFATQDGRAASDGNTNTYTSGFPVDLIMRHTKASDSTRTVVFDRLRGEQYLVTPATAAEASGDFILFDSMTGVRRSAVGASTGLFAHMFKRAPGFMDVAAYTGTGSARTVIHNLAAIPELMVVKNRSSEANWAVYNTFSGNTKGSNLNRDNAEDTYNTYWNGTSPALTEFTVNSNISVNANTDTYIAYLFATLPGISKVGSYTGTGNAINVDCGFTSGARFIMIKRTDNTGGWYVWDTAQGVVSGNDPYILLNDTSAQVTNTDYVDPLNAGFTVTSSAPAALNTSGGTYIFLAIA